MDRDHKLIGEAYSDKVLNETHACSCGCDDCGPKCPCDKNCECKKVKEDKVS